MVDRTPSGSVKQSARDSAEKKGNALPGGRFPINNKQDLLNAIRAVGRAKNPDAVKRFIIKRAKALGLSNLIPSSWTSGDAGSSSKAS